MTLPVPGRIKVSPSAKGYDLWGYEADIRNHIVNLTHAPKRMLIRAIVRRGPYHYWLPTNMLAYLLNITQ
jgi:hypothetical protein